MHTSLRNLFRNETGGFQPLGWQAEPKVRGTWSILSSCLITMLLCIWTAVHLNVPGYLGSTSQNARKVGWLVLGLIAPEMVAFTAWAQNQAASKLTKEMREAFGQPKPSTSFQSMKKFFSKAHKSIRELFNACCGLPQQISRQFESPVSHLSPMREDLYAQEAGGAGAIVGMYKLKTEPPGSSETPGATSTATDEAVAERNPNRQHKWTTVHSLYAIMGGFAFSTEGLEPNFLRGSPVRQTITTSGLALLARCDPGAIPDLSEEDIVDKSKADGFKKLILCIQAGRFLISVVFRMATNYPISLLELNTFAHCICALMIYSFWWSKPLDVREPTLILAREYPESAAFFSMATQLEGSPRELDLFQYFPEESEEHRVAAKKRSKFVKESKECRIRFNVRRPFVEEDDRNLDAVRKQLHIKRADAHSSVGILPMQIPPSYSILYRGQSLFGFCFEPREPQSQEGLFQTRRYVLLEPTDILRWRHASTAVSRCLFDPAEGFLDLQRNRSSHKFDLRHFADPMLDRARNWPSRYLNFARFNKRSIPFWIAFNASGLLYGGIHLLAWYAPFRTNAEEILWRVSGFIIIGAAPLITLYSTMFYFDQYLDFILRLSSSIQEDISKKSKPDKDERQDVAVRKLESFLESFSEPVTWFGIKFVQGFAIFYIFTAFSFYLASRVFLIVECFINLFYLDAHVYSVPTWTQYVPSIQ